MSLVAFRVNIEDRDTTEQTNNIQAGRQGRKNQSVSCRCVPSPFLINLNLKIIIIIITSSQKSTWKCYPFLWFSLRILTSTCNLIFSELWIVLEDRGNSGWVYWLRH